MIDTEEHKTHCSWFCKVPSGMSQREAEVKLAIFEPELPSGVKYFQFGNGQRVFESRSSHNPNPDLPPDGYGFCLITKLTGTEVPQIVADAARRIDSELRK